MDEEMTHIDEFLETSGISRDMLSSMKIEQLARIDLALKEMLAETEKAKTLLAANKITIVAVAEKSGISRKTLYNNESTLLAFIHYVTGSASDEDDKDALASTRRSLSDLKKQMSQLLHRDACEEELRLEIKRLANASRSKDKEIRALKNEKRKMQLELAEAKAKIPAASGRIIKI